MNDHALHSVTSADIAHTEPLGRALLALNNAHAQELSWLEPERLEYLVGEAFLARRIGDLDAFLLAFDQAARYDSPNYLWFRNRYERFVYVDRIVVASAARGRGCARRLYHDLFDHAVRAETPDIFGIGGTRGRDHMGSEMFRELDRETSDTTGATLDKNGLAALEPCCVLDGPDCGNAGQSHGGGLEVG